MKDQLPDVLKASASLFKWILGVCAQVLQQILCERIGIELISLEFWNMKAAIQVISEYLMDPGELNSTGLYVRIFPLF